MRVVAEARQRSAPCLGRWVGRAGAAQLRVGGGVGVGLLRIATAGLV